MTVLGCFWRVQGDNKILSFWLSAEILIYSEIVIMSWLYYFIREQKNLLPLIVFEYFKALPHYHVLQIIWLTERLIPNTCLWFPHKPRTSTVTHSEWDSHIWPIKNQGMSEKWVRFLLHLQQLHIYMYVIIEWKIAPIYSHLPKTRLAVQSPPLTRFQSVTHSVTELKKWQDVVVASTFTQIHHKPWDSHE